LVFLLPFGLFWKQTGIDNQSFVPMHIHYELVLL
jgi:hypothetical protein